MFTIELVMMHDCSNVDYIVDYYVSVDYLHLIEFVELFSFFLHKVYAVRMQATNFTFRLSNSNNKFMHG